MCIQPRLQVDEYSICNASGMVAQIGTPQYSRWFTLPCLTESMLQNSFVQPVHEVEVGNAWLLGLNARMLNFRPTSPCFVCLNGSWCTFHLS